ncbi:hypothetical protein HDU97_007804 [Phlyctochytrium planicorne]|nr:hypothetical protein HDU97_007804 [Phlyctochytrium planicorne]
MSLLYPAPTAEFEHSSLNTLMRTISTFQLSSPTDDSTKTLKPAASDDNITLRELVSSESESESDCKAQDQWKTSEERGYQAKERSPSPSIQSEVTLTNTRARRQRELFEQTMRDETRYEALRLFAEKVHSEENFLFLESLMALEGMGRESQAAFGGSRALERFILELPSSQAGSPDMIEGEMAILYIKFFDTFIYEHAPCQVNIPDSITKAISDILSQDPTRLPSNIFDAAADEVLALIYRDTFQKFLVRKSAKKQVSFGPVETLCVDKAWTPKEPLLRSFMMPPKSSSLQYVGASTPKRNLFSSLLKSKK